MPYTNRVLVALLLGILGGCSWGLKEKLPSFSVKGVVFINHSGHELHNVKLSALRTGNHVVCGYIPSGGECSTTFPVKEYKGGKLSISWDEAINSQLQFFSVNEFLMPIPQKLTTEKDYKAVFHIGSFGTLERRFL